MFIFKYEKGYCGSGSRYDKMGPAQEREWPELKHGEEQIQQMTKDVDSIGICHQLGYRENVQESRTHNLDFFPSEPCIGECHRWKSSHLSSLLWASGSSAVKRGDARLKNS